MPEMTSQDAQSQEVITAENTDESAAIEGAEYYARSSPSLQQRAGTEQKLWGAGSPQRLHTD